MTAENEKNLERDTTEIVAAYLRHNQMPANQVGSLITTVHGALKNISSPPEVEERTPAVPIRGSVQRDYVICLECGKKGPTMRRHLMSRHGLTPAEYRMRWNLRAEHPLTAPAYSERRSAMAKQLGLGRHRQGGAATESEKPKARTKTKIPPTRRGRRRSSPPT